MGECTVLSARWAMTYPALPQRVVHHLLPTSRWAPGSRCCLPPITACSMQRKWNWEAQEYPHPSKAGRCPLPSGTSPWPSQLCLLVSEPTLLSWVLSFTEANVWYWSFSFSISPPSEYSGLISFRIDWFDQYLTPILWPPDAKNCLI